MGNFLTFDFWFKLRPGVFVPSSFKIIGSFILFCLILAIISWFIKKRWPKGLYAGFWKKLFTFFWVNTFIGSLILFFNYEMVPFLSSRFWLLLWLLGLVAWLFFIIKILINIPQRRVMLDKEKEFKRYLP